MKGPSKRISFPKKYWSLIGDICIQYQLLYSDSKTLGIADRYTKEHYHAMGFVLNDISKANGDECELLYDRVMCFIHVLYELYPQNSEDETSDIKALKEYLYQQTGCS